MSDCTHFDDEGRAVMVDVGGKPETARTATARGAVVMAPETLAMIAAGDAFFDHGIAPSEVADQLFEAIRDGQFWVLTPDVPAELVSQRTEEIVAGRNPELRTPRGIRPR